MSEFTDGFWDWYIALISLAGIAGCALLLWSQSTVRVNVGADGKPDPTTGHVWDEDLTELNTPMPRWWMWLFYITIVFGIVYLVLYPGLGSYAGKLGWRSAGAYEQEVKRADAEYGPVFAAYASKEVSLVAADPQARVVGERLFMNYCAQCHAADARGNKGFPDLTDGDWIHGGDPATIEQTILHGRHGQMPPMAAAVGSDRDVENLAHYVRSLSGLPVDPLKAAQGKSKFVACIGCHGAEGRGNPALGAPNLSDKVWLHGGDLATIMETINKGRDNRMPAFAEILGEPKAHVLAAYVWGLSKRTVVPAAAVPAPAPAAAGQP
ncbi:cytochrome-c oxidase, cbb3-type subunit III [Massilia sp. DWR3-1-1]|uniref:cytochrome-c oxidase, cbb3-type subunit III n=1 Tax=Massilia sp. DWR3-1-1 TaxID=2804559 RepID=UPI003CF1971A